ncbi:FAR1 DNA binding domain [Macleaya cordata]|uniref:FAR1 DNA binding domain n=1 Tax=Macleaya cordata TaxID=56857 RepID=A0A200QX69_MACCD|nr:FAR1 DNA binding domain [Macleaya cordata]
MMIIRKHKEDKWVVTRVVEDHNHNLVAPSKRHKLRSLRRISICQEQVLENIRLAGVKTNLMMNYLSLESGGSRNVDLLQKMQGIF